MNTNKRASPWTGLSKEDRKKINENYNDRPKTKKEIGKDDKIRRGQIRIEKAIKRIKQSLKRTKTRRTKTQKSKLTWIILTNTVEAYPVIWTGILRQSVRERDHYTCQLCGRLQSDRVLSVHHIDYDKNNCKKNNLITLCVGCNTKVNSSRHYWTEYFNKKRTF